MARATGAPVSARANEPDRVDLQLVPAAEQQLHLPAPPQLHLLHHRSPAPGRYHETPARGAWLQPVWWPFYALRDLVRWLRKRA
ncbi:TPA: hypothetical protein DCY67_02190 [Candidatus Acetothermia bacterium]|nr:hypothetical protein [Candidatus Acetothermia bacterium]